MSAIQDSQTNFKPNLACIFLSVRANWNINVCPWTPCMPYVYLVTLTTTVLLRLETLNFWKLLFTFSDQIFQKFNVSNLPETFHTSANNMEKYVAAVHAEKKPFKCDICDYSFELKSHMKTHSASVHERKKPFKCHICDWFY